MNNIFFIKLILKFFFIFSVPFFILIFSSHIKHSKHSNNSLVKPILYNNKDGESIEGSYEYPDEALYKFGTSDYGKKVYASEGCAYCHTQIIRPTYAGSDMWRKGWGGKGEKSRETQARDYKLEDIAPFGYQRLGQDLSNVGNRITSKEIMHKHLSNPKGLNPDSKMPAYLHLYKTSPYGKAKLVPTSKAEALVDYLISLKKDQILPNEIK